MSERLWPEAVRIRLSDGQSLTVPLPAAAAPLRAVPMPAPAPAQATVPAAVAAASAVPGYTPVIALVEAVPSGAPDLALAAAGALNEIGLPPTLIALDGGNRLGARLGSAAPVPAWCWNEGLPELVVQQGPHRLMPGCAAEADLNREALAKVLYRLREQSHALVVDLGCRWEPGLFRPVLSAATHIWLLTRSGSWSGAEMRLEQAECSGWTPMDRVKVVAVGASPPPSGLLAGIGTALLPESGGVAAREFLLRELGRVPR